MDYLTMRNLKLTNFRFKEKLKKLMREHYL